MTTHDAAVTSGSLLPAPLIDTIEYVSDNEVLTETVMTWLPRFRHIIHQTTRPIVIVGCMVRDIDPTRSSRYFKTARAWLKRVEVFDNNKALTRQLPADAGILVVMDWVSHAQAIPLKNQALKNKHKDGSPRGKTPILDQATLKDVKQLLRCAFLDPEVFAQRVHPKFPHSYSTLDATSRALMQVQANATVRRLAWGDAVPKTARPLPDREATTTMADTPKGSKQKTERGALKAFLARHPTREELDTREWQAAKTDDAKGRFLLPIAHAEGIPTTLASLTNGVSGLRRAAERAHDAAAQTAAAALPLDPAPLPPPPPPPPPGPTPPPPVEPQGGSHQALEKAHAALLQGFESLRVARESWRVMGEQLDFFEMALQDAQRYTGRDLISDMQTGIQAALNAAMIEKFGQFMPWAKTQ